MNDVLLTILVSSGLVVLGLSLMVWHLRQNRQHQADPQLDDHARKYFRAQCRRRVQIAGLLLLLGILIPLGDDLFIAWQNFPRAWIMLWMGIGGILLWIMLLAAVDWLASQFHARTHDKAVARLDQFRQDLAAEAQRLKQHKSNGKGH